MLQQSRGRFVPVGCFRGLCCPCVGTATVVLLASMQLKIVTQKCDGCLVSPDRIECTVVLTISRGGLAQHVCLCCWRVRACVVLTSWMQLSGPFHRVVAAWQANISEQTVDDIMLLCTAAAWLPRLGLISVVATVAACSAA